MRLERRFVAILWGLAIMLAKKISPQQKPEAQRNNERKGEEQAPQEAYRQVVEADLPRAAVRSIDPVDRCPVAEC